MDTQSAPPSEDRPAAAPPPVLFVNGRKRPLAGATSVAELVKEFGLATRPVAVEVNGAIVRRADHATAPVRPGDRVEIVTLVGGG